MTTETNHFQLAKNLQTYLIGELAKYLNYSWTPEFISEEMEKVKAKVKKDVPFIDFACMSGEQLKELGFRTWCNESDFLLIPLWAYPVLKSGTTLHCIGGKSALVHDDYQNSESENYIDDDVRFGCIAWGVTPANKLTQK